MTMKLEGKVALVSGLGRGIGRAIAVKLAAEGARVAVHDLDDGPAQETAAAIRAAGGEATAAGAVIDVAGRQIDVGVNPDLLQAVERMVPLGRGGTPDEAAGAVFLFCTPESNYISGQTIVCGGGFMM
jgi:NAD(P)-dependent dehydrogenase (short-subunit alcohol dehydrogenase family)